MKLLITLLSTAVIALSAGCATIQQPDVNPFRPDSVKLSAPKTFVESLAYSYTVVITITEMAQRLFETGLISKAMAQQVLDDTDRARKMLDDAHHIHLIHQATKDAQSLASANSLLDKAGSILAVLRGAMMKIGVKNEA